jgi:crossover junction endodeoxyribonuclease RusA
MMKVTVFLPWPDRKLSPNARHAHWATLAHAKKKAKADAYHLALEAGLGKIDADSVNAKYTFFPPDRRTRDRDNLIGSCKALQDGIALAIGVDDGNWITTYEIAGAVEKNGMVKVELEWGHQ